MKVVPSRLMSPADTVPTPNAVADTNVVPVRVTVPVSTAPVKKVGVEVNVVPVSAWATAPAKNVPG